MKKILLLLVIFFCLMGCSVYFGNEHVFQEDGSGDSLFSIKFPSYILWLVEKSSGETLEASEFTEEIFGDEKLKGVELESELWQRRFFYTTLIFHFRFNDFERFTQMESFSELEMELIQNKGQWHYSHMILSGFLKDIEKEIAALEMEITDFEPNYFVEEVLERSLVFIFRNFWSYFNIEYVIESPHRMDSKGVGRLSLNGKRLTYRISLNKLLDIDKDTAIELTW